MCPSGFCCSWPAWQGMAGWSCAGSCRSPGAEESGADVLRDSWVCFLLWSEKQKQLLCPPLGKGELDSCRTSTSVEKHLIFFFSFLHCPVITASCITEGRKGSSCKGEKRLLSVGLVICSTHFFSKTVRSRAEVQNGQVWPLASGKGWKMQPLSSAGFGYREKLDSVMAQLPR